MAAKLKGDALHVQGSDRWYVTDGLNAVGPVRRDLLVRGIEAGRVPLDSFIRHEGWKVWRPLTDFAEADGAPNPRPPGPSQLSSLLEDVAEELSGDHVIADERSGEISDRPTVELLSLVGSPALRSDGMVGSLASTLDGGEISTQVSRDLLGRDRPTLASYLDDDEETNIPTKPTAPVVSAAGVAARASGVAPLANARTSTPAHSMARTSTPEGSLAGTARPSTEDDLRGAADLSEALHLLLNALVRRTGAQTCLLHRMSDDGGTTVCAHGPHMVDALGSRTRLLDPAVVAAAGGNIVVSEPAPGPAGDATLQRLRKSGIDIEGSAMFPIRPRGRLLGIVEIGKDKRFDMRELARAEDVLRAFVRKAEAGGWA